MLLHTVPLVCSDFAQSQVLVHHVDWSEVKVAVVDC